MTTKSYLFLLGKLSSKLLKIKEFEQANIHKDVDLTELQFMIKEFTGNVESVLDYTLFYLHEKIYVPRLKAKDATETEISNQDRRISFINSKSVKEFDKRLNKMFPEIKTEFPEIYQSVHNAQKFNFESPNQSWITQADNLANHFKHRKLEKVDTRENADIEYLELPGNIIIRNSTFRNNKHSVVIDGKPLTKENAKYLGVTNFDGHIETFYAFETTGLPVVDTLEWILANTEQTVHKIDEQIDNIQ